MQAWLSFLLEIDQQSFLWLNQSLANPVFDWIMPFVTSFSNWWFVLGLLWLWMLWKGDRRLRSYALLILVGVILANVISSELLKPFFHRYRPCKTLEGFRLLGHCGGKYGFPSSHASNAAVVAFLLRKALPGYQILWLGLMLLIGFTRIYVGVHYPGDVLGGFLLGWLLATMLFAMGQYLTNKTDKIKV